MPKERKKKEEKYEILYTLSTTLSISTWRIRSKKIKGKEKTKFKLNICSGHVGDKIEFTFVVKQHKMWFMIITKKNKKNVYINSVYIYSIYTVYIYIYMNK